MFLAINTELIENSKKAQLEKNKILEIYLQACNTLKMNNFLQIKVVNKVNELFYEKAKTNLYFLFIQKTPILIIETLGIIDKFLESKELLFEIILKYINEKKYIRAKKLLNIAIKKKWYCNKLYDLLKILKTEYMGNLLIYDNNEFMKRKINVNKFIWKFSEI